VIQIRSSIKVKGLLSFFFLPVGSSLLIRDWLLCYSWLGLKWNRSHDRGKHSSSSSILIHFLRLSINVCVCRGGDRIECPMMLVECSIYVFMVLSGRWSSQVKSPPSFIIILSPCNTHFCIPSHHHHHHFCPLILIKLA
jgi:hypothetical protein